MGSEKVGVSIGLGGCLIWLFFAVCWVVNLVKLVKCDFEAPYRDEITHAIGLFIPPASAITCWL